MFAPFYRLGLGLIRVAVSVAAGGGVALVAIGALALFDAERWDYRVLDTVGPPIGPLLLSIGAGLATTGGTMYSLFFPGGMQSGDRHWPALRPAAGRA